MNLQAGLVVKILELYIQGPNKRIFPLGKRKNKNVSDIVLNMNWEIKGNSFQSSIFGQQSTLKI